MKRATAARKESIEFITPPNLLKAKVGSCPGGMDLDAVMRAEQAVLKLQAEFTDWINADVKRLDECREAFARTPNRKTREAFLRASHDLKGQAFTFGYPLASRIASSLCLLLETKKARSMIALVDAHVDAIRAVVRDNLKDATNETAESLASELEAQVSEQLEPAQN